MSLKSKTTNELVKIATSGAGFNLNVSRKTTNELIKIAAAASTSGAQLTFSGLASRTTSDLVKIGTAGKGCVVIED